MEKLIVLGSSGHAKVVIDIIELAGTHTIVGLLDPFRTVGEETSGYPVLGKEEDLPRLAQEHQSHQAIVAIGDNTIRAEVVAKVKILMPTLTFATAVHPRAQLAKSVTLGPGSVIMAGAVLNADTSVGAFCIVNTGATIDHDGWMGDFSCLAPGATVGGKVRIGAHSAIGLGANVVHEVTVGEHTLVGAGATVMKDVESFAVAYGTPARVIRKRAAGERYL
jgi:sugar O-acyltransferase (sialic acid O-acetyltransferase NeuD family)